MKTQQTFVNRKNGPIHVSVEPWPDCFELEPGEKLTLVWDAKEVGDAAEVHFINDNELVIFPDGDLSTVKYMMDGQDAESRSWSFKHNPIKK